MYDKQSMWTVSLPNYDYGDGDTVDVTSVMFPTGYAGRLIDIGVSVTETFACDSTAACVKVGTATNDDAYGKLNIPDGSADTNYINAADDTDVVISAEIPAATQIEITPVAGTDSGTAAGKGNTYITFEIYKV